MIRKNLNKADMVRILALLALVAGGLAAAVPAGAVPQVNTGYGDQWAWRGTDVNAMGSTGIALYRGGMSNLYNPALLADETANRLDLGVSLDQEHEDRFQPLFDSFDSYVADAAIASNRNHWWSGNLAWAGRLGQGERPLVLGVSLVDRYPFDYRFEEELRNPSPFPPGNGEPARDQIMENRVREVDGSLTTASVGLGAGLGERISVGAAVHYAFGKKTDTRSVRDFYTDDGDSSYREDRIYDMDGMNFTLGVRGVISRRVEIGLAWETPLKASGDFTGRRADVSGDPSLEATTAGHYKYPSIYRAGLTFLPRTDPATVFTMELEYIPWEKLEDTSQPEGDNSARLNDTFDVRIGLQHTFHNGVPLRFGFRHYDIYSDDESSASAFSAGTGFALGSGMISASVELTKTRAVLDHQFPYPPNYFGPGYEADPQADVEDTRFRIGVGYTLHF